MSNLRGRPTNARLRILVLFAAVCLLALPAVAEREATEQQGKPKELSQKKQ